MIKLAAADIKKAAESLSFRQVTQAQETRDVERLTDTEVGNVASHLKLSHLSKKQIFVADQMGRSLAKQAAAGTAGAAIKALAPIGRSLKKSFTFARTRALKGKRVGIGTAAKEVAKDVVPVAGAAYMGSRALNSSGS